MNHPSQQTYIPPTHGVQSLDRVFRILDLVAEHHESGILQSDIQRLTTFDRTTTHRMLTFLASRGYVTQTDSTAARWRLGIHSMGMGLKAFAQAPVIDLMRSTMKTLARLTGDNVFLVCQMGDQSYTLHLEQGEMAIQSYVNLVGTTRLLGLGTGSMALLAALPDQAIQSHLQRHQPAYTTHHFSPLKMQRAIQRTRQLGYTLASDPAVSGTGVAFKIKDVGLLALSVLSSRPRMPVARRHQIASLIMAETSEIRG